MTHLITSKTDWTPEIIHEVWKHIEDIATNDMKIDYYTPQVEIISAEQMVDAYASSALPIHYNHWTFGKQFIEDWKAYQNGDQHLAYEIVLNSDPCIAYLMEENPAWMQALVLAHASVGHSHVYKNNYMFKDAAQAASIVDFMVFARSFIRDCENKYGEAEVEAVLDSAHAIKYHGIDKRVRKHVKAMSEEDALMHDYLAAEEEQKTLDIIMQRTVMLSEEDALSQENPPEYGEENLLYFIYKNAPNMPRWKREILRIVQKVSQFFYPNMQCKVVHEGFATFTHYYIMNELEARGVISSDAQLAWMASHANVIYQSKLTDKHFSPGFNPYNLGFEIFLDIKRICENPTDEDREIFSFAGGDWREVIKDAVANYNDESFIQQFMSPYLIRKMKLMEISIPVHSQVAIVTEVCDDRGWKNIRESLARSYNPINYLPEVVVNSVDYDGDRSMLLEYRPFKDRHLHEDSAIKTVKHIEQLWGYPVRVKIPQAQKVALRDIYWTQQLS